MNLESYVTEAADAVRFKLGKRHPAHDSRTIPRVLVLSPFAVREPSDAVIDDDAFAPDMAHQIYGEKENIFGYKDLQINVLCSAGPLDFYYEVKYSKKVGCYTKRQ